MMAVYEFDLVVDGVDLDRDERVIAAMDERAGDMTFAGHGLEVTVAIERSAPSLASAINSAIDDIESIAEAQVVRVLPDSYVSQTEIGVRTNRSRQSVYQLVNGQRGPGGFPPPVFGSGRTALWQWSEVASWFERAGLETIAGSPDGDVIEAINAALVARRVFRRLGHDDQETVRSLVA